METDAQQFLRENSELLPVAEQLVGYDLNDLDNTVATEVVKSLLAIADTLNCDVATTKQAFILSFRDEKNLNDAIDKNLNEEQEEIETRQIDRRATAAYIKRQWIRELRAERWQRNKDYFDQLYARRPTLSQTAELAGYHNIYDTIIKVCESNFSIDRLKNDIQYIESSAEVETGYQTDLFIVYRILAEIDNSELIKETTRNKVFFITKLIFNNIDIAKTDEPACLEIFKNKIDEYLIRDINSDLFCKIYKIEPWQKNLVVMRMMSLTFNGLLDRLTEARVELEKEKLDEHKGDDKKTDCLPATNLN